MDDNIEIVIKISEKEYNEIKENKYGVFGGHIFETIRNGRPLSDYPPNYQRMAIGLPPVIHHEKSITKEDIDKSSWIPVTERLPEKEGTYLTTIDEYIMTSSYFPDCKHGSKWCPDDVIASDNVIAWMPVPEPYRESEEKKE